MNKTVIDVCGLACPEPLIAFTDAAKKADTAAIEIRFDCAAARDNITRTAASMGWGVTSVNDVSGYTVMTLAKAP